MEDRKRFVARLARLKTSDRMDIEMAYDIVKEAHRRFRRESGERYFEHLRNVALILIDECGIKEPDVVTSALLHDSVEDTPIFGNIMLPEKEWRETARYRLKKIFDYRVADTVIALTKPRLNGEPTPGKRKIRDRAYMKQVAQGTPEAGIVKLADRLHNLRTLDSVSREKRERKIKETEEFILPLLRKIDFGVYVLAAAILKKKIDRELERLKTGVKRKK